MTQVKYIVRRAYPMDILPIIEMCKAVYKNTIPWSENQLKSHQDIFPEGQLVIEDINDGSIVGLAASLIVFWDDYEWNTPWRDFTDGGFFTNHDPKNGRTLYGAEIMVHPGRQGTGAGSLLYKARFELVKKLGLRRIRAGARLRDYHKYSEKMSADDYVRKVIEKKLHDSTLSFQLKRGFHVLKVIPDYLRHDPESMGNAALIECLNPEKALPEDFKFLSESEYYSKKFNI